MLRMNGGAQTLNLKHRLADSMRTAFVKLGKVTANHKPNHPFMADFRPCKFTRVLTVPKNRDTIGEFFYLGKTMRNVNDADTLGAQILDDTKKVLRLVLGKARGGFIHDENARVD